MVLTFYPHEDLEQRGTLEERIAILRDAAEHYKAAILEEKIAVVDESDPNKRGTPHDFLHAYNWPEIAMILEEVRGLPEGNPEDKDKKVRMLNQLAVVYEVLRAAKMPKLEAIRSALVAEAKQLGGGEASPG